MRDVARKGFLTIRRKLLHRFARYNDQSFPEVWKDIASRLQVFGRTSTGNRVTAYRDTGAAFRDMWSAVGSATKEIKWQTYICKDDDVGKITMAKLENAHRKGVATELLYDCGGNITGRTRLVERLRRAGARVICHRPFFAKLWMYVSTGMKWHHSPALRNHRKILIVDRLVGFAGGLNIGDDYCTPCEGGNGRFRDTHCRVEGPAVQHLDEVYEDTKLPIPWRLPLARWRQLYSRRIRITAGTFVPYELYRTRGLFYHNIVASMKNWTVTKMAGIMNRGGSAILRTRMWRKRLARVLEGHLSVNSPAPAALLPDDRTLTAKKILQRLSRAVQSKGNVACETCELLENQDALQGGARKLRWLQKRRSEIIKEKYEKIREKSKLSREKMRERVLSWKKRSGVLQKRREELIANRSLTAELRLKKISDMDPIPEALHWKESLPSHTQILMSNPHTRDWSIQMAMWIVTRKVYRRLWITTPYYMPHRKLTLSLIQAARRGVDVRIIAGSNRTTDPFFMWHASQYMALRLLRAGVRIYEFQGPQVMHAKTVVADSTWSSIGSYNWDIMSNKNMEVCVTHFGLDLARQVEAHFYLDMQCSKELQLEEFEARPWWRFALSWCAFYSLKLAELFTFYTYKDQDLTNTVD